VTSAAPEKRVGQLLALLEEMHQLCAELREVIGRKLAAMRRADTEAMAQAAGRERFLTERLEEREGLRKQLMELIGEQFGRDGKASRAMTISELASRVGEPLAVRLTALGGVLRQAMQQTAEANRVAALVGREMLGHFQRIYAVMAAGGREQSGYSRLGGAQSGAGARLFEVTG